MPRDSDVSAVLFKLATRVVVVNFIKKQRYKIKGGKLLQHSQQTGFRSTGVKFTDTPGCLNFVMVKINKRIQLSTGLATELVAASAGICFLKKFSTAFVRVVTNS